MARPDLIADAREIDGFVAGTTILTPEGPKPIESVRAGDLVLSRPQSGEATLAQKRVLKTFESDSQALWLITFVRNPPLSSESSDKPASGYVVVKGNHPFWVTGVAPGQQSLFDSEWDYLGDEEAPLVPNTWRRADKLTPGMGLTLVDGAGALVLDVRRIYKSSDPLRGWVWEWSAEYSDFVEGYDITFGSNGPECQILRRGHAAKPDDIELDAGDGEGLYVGKVYSLEVEDFYTCFVHETGIWVRASDSESQGPA